MGEVKSVPSGKYGKTEERKRRPGVELAGAPAMMINRRHH